MGIIYGFYSTPMFHVTWVLELSVFPAKHMPCTMTHEIFSEFSATLVIYE